MLLNSSVILAWYTPFLVTICGGEHLSDTMVLITRLCQCGTAVTYYTSNETHLLPLFIVYQMPTIQVFVYSFFPKLLLNGYVVLRIYFGNWQNYTILPSGGKLISVGMLRYDST